MGLLPISCTYDLSGSTDVARVTLERENDANGEDFAVRVTIVAGGTAPRVIKSKVVWGVEELDAVYNAARVAWAILETSSLGRSGVLRASAGEESLEELSERLTKLLDVPDSD